MLSLDELRGWLAERTGLEIAEIADEMPIFSDGLLDSFDLVGVVAFIEGKLGRRVRPLDINLRNFDTVNAIAAFATTLVSARP